jgi:cbb3-type cytochrome oxidase maturation protein
MSILLYLIPISLGLGVIGLAAFLWSLKSGQYEDLDGAAERVLLDEDRPKGPAGHTNPVSGPATGVDDRLNASSASRTRPGSRDLRASGR